MTTNPAHLYAAAPYVPEAGVHVRDPAPDPYLLPRPGWPQPEANPAELARQLNAEEWAALREFSSRDQGEFRILACSDAVWEKLIDDGLIEAFPVCSHANLTDLGRAVLAARESADTEPSPPPELDDSGLFEANPVAINGAKP